MGQQSFPTLNSKGNEQHTLSTPQLLKYAILSIQCTNCVYICNIGYIGFHTKNNTVIMEEQVSNLLVFFFTGYLLFTIISYIVWRQLKMLIFEVSIGIVALAVLYFTTGFPFERTVAFGGFNPYLLTLLLLF